MGKTNGHALVVQELGVVRFGDTMQLRQHKALQCGQSILREDGLESVAPLPLKAFRILLVPLNMNEHDMLLLHH